MFKISTPEIEQTNFVNITVEFYPHFRSSKLNQDFANRFDIVLFRREWLMLMVLSRYYELPKHEKMICLKISKSIQI
ncbi:hypothetical protein DERP_005665 [Dermatophagoides pteronyssinus]|uniref:Uncharacterized protein n=1 Tax=Dermatophagoides pteronyssinus TaxID=6956 RepID=A0ABQ8J973_DERPT|nr:hypothetical protein DERP_005665 [Dermatophagoides pteronyssinus]